MKRAYHNHVIAIWLLLAGAVLSACSAVAVNGFEPALTPSGALAMTNAEPGRDMTPTAVSSTQALPQARSVLYKQIEYLEEVPEGDPLKGYLVLAGPRSEVVDLGSGSSRSLLTSQTPVGVSPDHEKLAIIQFGEDGRNQLLVEDALGNPMFAADLDPLIMPIIGTEWLTNDIVVFNAWDTRGKPQTSYDVSMVSLANESWTRIASEYPSLSGMISGPAGSMPFVSSTVVYDPTTEFVVYPASTSSTDRRIMLWDISESVAVASVQDEGEFYHRPIWAPDGSSVLVAATREHENSGGMVAEWFAMDRFGGVIQITHYSATFRAAQIGPASWSPDGQRVAFWLASQSGECSGNNLAVLTVRSRETVIYCVPGAMNSTSGPPVWSPDGVFLAIQSSNDEGAWRTTLVSPRDAWAVQLFEDVYPIAWMR